MICIRCNNPDPCGDYWLGLCQMCWEEECAELWWKMIANNQPLAT